MPLRTPRRILAALTAAAALVLLPVLPAHAATGTGWARVAHLSPDTRQVDVRLAPLDEGGKVIRIDDVAYGAVSKYLSLPAGEYAVAMRPAGSPDSATPVIQTSFVVKAGTASTVAVFGRNADLQPKVIVDSLRQPARGDSRVRIVQAATGDDPVTVTAADDDERTLVSNASLGTVSDYADVPAGTWRLTALRDSVAATSKVRIGTGQIATLFVLEDADGSLVFKRVLDSSSVGDVPTGFLATGGGYLAHQGEQQEGGLLGIGGAVLAAMAAAAAIVLLRRRRAHA